MPLQYGPLLADIQGYSYPSLWYTETSLYIYLVHHLSLQSSLWSNSSMITLKIFILKCILYFEKNKELKEYSLALLLDLC